MKQVQIVTDGSCIGNPGPGGWACILRCDSEERELSGGEAQTTNNRMELTAAINGLKALRGICEVEVVTDSQYLKQGVTQYLSRWKINGWRTSDPVLNQDLWRELDDVASRQTIRWTWIAGHDSRDLHNRCDALAQAAARKEANHSVRPALALRVPLIEHATDLGSLRRRAWFWETCCGQKFGKFVGRSYRLTTLPPSSTRSPQYRYGQRK